MVFGGCLFWLCFYYYNIIIIQQGGVMERITCKLCGRYLGWAGIISQFHFAPCPSCKTEIEINKIAGDIQEVVKFQFDVEIMKKPQNRQDKI